MSMQDLFRPTWIFVIVGVLGGFGNAYAQQGHGSGQRMYDPARVDTVEGVVTAVDTMTGRHGRHKGIHLQLESDDSEDTVVIHVGPLFYLRDQGITFRSDEAVTVRGARMAEGAPVFIAAEVWTRDQSWRLRNDEGQPAWRGQRQGKSQ
jgi:hypothetical protein